MSSLSVFAPAKLNLFLAVTGRRTDRFHDLVSLAVKLDFGDVLHAEPAEEFSVTCDDPAVPCGETNLVLKAARAFARASNWNGGARFRLEKRIPTGAGLGGGSSDAVATLRALNRLAPSAGLASLNPAALLEIAATVGSDCPLFLQEGPVMMRGRGERITELPSSAARRLRGRRVLVFKPGFAIATPWAYGQLAARAPGSYLAPEDAETRLFAWIEDDDAPAEAILFNNMEPPAFAKFLALPALLDELRNDFSVAPRMSGSGSGCFAFLGENTDAARMMTAIHEAWGESAFVTEARVL